MKDKRDKTVCKGSEESIILSYYGELGPAESAELEAHAKSCPACREYRDELARTLGTVPVLVPKPWEARRAAEGVMARINRAYVTPPGAWRLVPALVGTALLAAGVLVTVYNPFGLVQKPPLDPVVVASADWDTIEHIDVINDLDVVEAIDDNEEIDLL